MQHLCKAQLLAVARRLRCRARLAQWLQHKRAPRAASGPQQEGLGCGAAGSGRRLLYQQAAAGGVGCEVLAGPGSGLEAGHSGPLRAQAAAAAAAVARPSLHQQAAGEVGRARTAAAVCHSAPRQRRHQAEGGLQRRPAPAQLHAATGAQAQQGRRRRAWAAAGGAGIACWHRVQGHQACAAWQGQGLVQGRGVGLQLSVAVSQA